MAIFPMQQRNMLNQGNDSYLNQILGLNQPQRRVREKATVQNSNVGTNVNTTSSAADTANAVSTAGGLNQNVALPNTLVAQQSAVEPQQDVIPTGGLNQTSNLSTAATPTSQVTTPVSTGTNTGTALANQTLAPQPIEFDPVIGTWAQIGGVGTGFDYSPFAYNDINSLSVPKTRTSILDTNNPYGDSIGYEDYLNSLTSYKNVIKPQPTSYNFQIGMGTSVGGGNPWAIGNRNQAPVDPFSGYTPFTYSDANSQSAVSALESALEKALYTTSTQGGMGGVGAYTVKNLNRNKLDKDLQPFLKDGTIEIGRTGVSYLDALNDKQRDKILAKVSASTGIHAEQLTKLYNDYHYANKTFFDPSGTNWADLMSSGAAEDVLTGVKDWSGSGKDIDKANAILSRDSVAKEYTAKDLGVTADNPVKEITDSSGNKFYAVYNQATGTQFIARDEESANKIAAGNSGYTYDKDTGMFYGQKDRGEYIDASYYYLNKPNELRGETAINEMMTIDDFLPTGVTIRTATPEQIASAQNALNGQKELMKTYKDPYSFTDDAGKTHNKNKFNLTKDSDPLKKKGRHYFINDITGEVTSIKNKNVATWAADDAANDTPLLHKGKYYYIDKDDGSIKSTKSQFIADGESATQGYLNIKDWRKLLPAGVTEANATPEQIAQAKSDLSGLQENLIDLTGKGSVFNLFKSMDLPIPDDFNYDPEKITRDFNTLVNAGIDPRKVNPKLTPENVYKGSLEYDAPSGGGLGGFVGSFIVPALSIAYPGIAPILQGLSGAYQLSQGNIMGALGSFAGATGVMKDLFGGQGVLGGFKNSLTNTLQSNFGLSADVAGKLVDSGIWAGGNAVFAALNDQNVLEALARGAGEGYLRSTIASNLAESIPNESVRNFITQRLTDTVVNALEGGNVNFEQLLGNAFASGLFTDMGSKAKALNT
jgi:hypothetical protein